MSKSIPSSDVDLDKVREKYRQERDKRLGGPGRRPPEIVGDLRRFLHDPFSPVCPREPLFDQVEVICIGAGFGGLVAGARLKQIGLKKVRLLDSAGDVGGVWYWNRYPECKCDVESLIYMPLLEDTGYIPTMKYASAPEIAEHARRIAARFDLYQDAVFHTTVTDIAWDETLNLWHVHTDRQDDMLAQFIVLAIGPMNVVKLPDIPGINSYKGKSFHTSRWDYSFTGGDPGNPVLAKLADKNVGFIGTGATGLQCVAPLGRSAKKLYLFQRTPSAVGVRGNKPIDTDEVRRWEPGWQKRRQENFTAINFGESVTEDLVRDGWTDLYSELSGVYGGPSGGSSYDGLAGEALRSEKERVDFRKMEKIRQRIDSIVKNPETAEKLKPYYNYLCKRPGWHDEYLDAFNLRNVELVDTEGRGVERVCETGVVANGRQYDLDCLIFGTGFEVETSGRLMMGFDVLGRGGIALSQKWANGLCTLHGLMTSQFPNLFILPGINSQAVVTTNVIHMTQEYVDHVAYIVKSMRERKVQVFDLTHEAEAAWVKTIIDRRIDNTEFLEACTPGRRNYEGNSRSRPVQNTVFGGGPREYFAILKAWRDTGQLPGLSFSRHKVAVVA